MCICFKPDQYTKLLAHGNKSSIVGDVAPLEDLIMTPIQSVYCPYSFMLRAQKRSDNTKWINHTTRKCSKIINQLGSEKVVLGGEYRRMF